MKKANNKSELAILRQKAEELLKKKPSQTASRLSETKTPKLIHELEVLQIELELQHEELVLARSASKDAAEKSNHQNNLILEATGEGILGLDLAGNNTFVNPKAVEILGYSVEELLGKNFHELFHHHHRDGTVYPVEDCAINNTLVSGKPACGEEYFWRRDGTGFPVDFSSLPIIEQYQITGAVVAFRDITARKQAEEDTRKAYEVLEATLDALPDVLFNVGLDGYCYQVHSPRTELLNRPASDIIGKKIQDILPPMISEVIMSAIKEAHEKGFSVGKQYEMKVPSGTCWFELSVSRKVNTPDGPPHFIILKRDITERKLAYEALGRSEAKLAKMISNLGDVIVIIDQDGINKYTSPNVEKWFGWKPEEIVGVSTWDNVHPEDLDSAWKFVGDLIIEPNASGPTEFRHRCKDGSYRWIEIRVVNLLHDPDIQGLVGNYHDITHRKGVLVG